MKNKLFRRILSFVLALVMVLPLTTMTFAEDDASDTLLIAPNPNASEETVGETSAQARDEQNRARTYSTFYDKHVDDPRPDLEYIVYAKDFTNPSTEYGATLTTVDGTEAISLPETSGSFEVPITITEEGIYNIEVGYYAHPSAANDIELSVLIDGESQYATAERILLSKKWVDDEKSFQTNEDGTVSFREDDNGNQIRPSLQEYLTWQSATLDDTDGLFGDPLRFYFTKGEHVITINSDKARFAVSYVKVFNQESVANAKDVDTVTTDATVAAQTKEVNIYLEGEGADFKSDITLYATYDRSTYLSSPSDPVVMLYNTIGAQNWARSGQYITWKFTMEEAGWVKIGVRARQNQMRGLYSNRRLYIDGVVPCAEAEALKFYYSEDWQVTTPTDSEGNTLYFWLEAGEHELTLEAVPGEIGDIMRQLDDLVYYLNSYYRQILQITGPTPDEYNTYMIHKQIPSILGDFEQYSVQLRELKARIEYLAGTEGTEAVSLETMAKLLDKCVERPDNIPLSLSQLKDDLAALSQWMTDYRSQYLEVDIIEITSADVDFTSVKENWWKKFVFDFKSFIGSFFTDYNTLSKDDKEALVVWVQLGRDQAQIVKELGDGFIEETGIKVGIKLVQGGILEATLAGKGPDIALFIGGEFPIQLAARDCLVDISQYPDYEEVIKQFSPHIMTLFTYTEGENKGVYGLPVTQNFPMLFMRTDVLDSFGFTEAPETWDELIDMLPALQRSYMGVGFNHGIFSTLLVQNGMNYYNENYTLTRFDEPTAIQCFEQWVEYYTKYSFEQSFDAFTRFRSGEYPIVTNDYTFYNQLYMAAPEIRGLWEFALIPGTVREDGTVDHSVISGSSGAIIFSKLDEEQRADAWEFIKWFTSTEVQSEYGRSLEALLGPLGRYATANVEAVSQLAWSKSDLDLILEQMEHTIEIDIIPSNYITSRNLLNAFREAVNHNKNPRDMLLWYNNDINDEIKRKHEELGIPYNPPVTEE